MWMLPGLVATVFINFFRGLLVVRRLMPRVRHLSTVVEHLSSKQVEGPLAVYKDRVAQDKLIYDSHQQEIVDDLQRCYEEV